MALTEEKALREYARMMNRLDASCLGSLLADDFVYESQQVFNPIESRSAFLEFIRPKLMAIKKSSAMVFAELGTVEAYGRRQPCVILAQGEKDNLVALVIAKVDGAFLKRLDLCVVPSPATAIRSGDYPV